MDLIFLKSLRPLYCDYISRILCVRRAQQRRPPRPPFMYFYSRPYARGDRSAVIKRSGYILFLLAPLREGRPGDLHFADVVRPISTHAPTRGATPESFFSYRRFRYFYSRPYARGDARSYIPQAQLLAISTHAPTRGTTRPAVRVSGAGSNFYSRPYARGNSRCPAHAVRRPQFLLTPLREGQPVGGGKPHQRGKHFYSRPYARGNSNFSQNHKLIYMINC